jgi:hypothetical protein
MDGGASEKILRAAGMEMERIGKYFFLPRVSLALNTIEKTECW